MMGEQIGSKRGHQALEDLQGIPRWPQTRRSRSSCSWWTSCPGGHDQSLQTVAEMPETIPPMRGAWDGRHGLKASLAIPPGGGP